MRISTAIVAVLTGAALAVSAAEAEAHQSDLQTAQALLKSGHADQALTLVDPIIEKAMLKEAKDPGAICPSAAAAFLQSFMKGNFVVTVDNDWCDALLVKGYALNDLKRPEEAADVLKTLVGHAPGNAQYLIEYAYTVRVNGEMERALDLYKRAEGVASKVANRETAAHWRAAALRGQGFSLSELKRWDEAVKAYQQSLKYEPANEIARHELKYIEENRPR